MSATHDHSHEVLLQRWATGERLETDEEARLRDCETCRERMSEVEKLVGELEQLGREDLDEELQEALEADVPDFERRAVQRAERKIFGERTATRSPSGVRGWQLLAAALVLVASFVAYRSWSRDDGVAPVEDSLFYLGEGFTELAPAGFTEHIDTFRWEHALAPGGYYELRFYLPGAQDPFYTVPETTETRWTPDPELVLPDHFRWEVRAYDGLDEPDGSADAEVSHSRD